MESRTNQVWHVKIKGERALRTVKVTDETLNTVVLLDTKRGGGWDRYLTADVNFIERQAR